MNGYLDKQIDKDACEFVETIKPEHFIIEGDFMSHAYYIELEGCIQSTQEECSRFLKSIKENEKIVMSLKSELQNIEELLSMHDVCSCGTCAELRPKRDYIKQVLTQHSFSTVKEIES